MSEKKQAVSSREVIAATSAAISALEEHFCDVDDAYRMTLAVAALNAAICILGGKPRVS
ncbi:hypothetical protein I1A46_01725 [Serratia liquefaciens]|uniref:hypothetical protein n=1 Tax=Serratia liquefaciens TaxID=614 RepID=UPI0018A759F1|nr:hypothetical protein [Serratia liquefaciens]MBF8103844.1 hypothetical protein [Serratia liquefaciens]